MVLGIEWFPSLDFQNDKMKKDFFGRNIFDRQKVKNNLFEIPLKFKKPKKKGRKKKKNANQESQAVEVNDS